MTDIPRIVDEAQSKNAPISGRFCFAESYFEIMAWLSESLLQASLRQALLALSLQP